MSKIKDIKKIIKNETKVISERFASKITKDNLSLTLTPRDLKNALQFSKTENKPIARFTKDYIAQIGAFIEYIADDKAEVEIVFDPKCDPLYIEKFNKAWKEYFALKIYTKYQDIKELRRKNLISAIFGILSLLVVIGFGIGTIYCNNRGYAIATIVVEAVFSIISWVLIWECFYYLVFTMRKEKKELFALYNMYKVKIQKQEAK